MKGKFIYKFADGTQMVDRNRYKTIKEAKSWAKGHNKSAPKSDKVIAVIKRPIKKKTKTRYIKRLI